MHETVQQMLSGHLKDCADSSDSTVEPEHVRKVRELNWSYALRKITRWGPSDQLDYLSDLDCMAINIGVAEPVPSDGTPRFIHLDQFVVDLDNRTAFKKNCALGTMFRVVRTENNDRARSRLTDRKPFDLSAAFQSAKSSFFAKNWGEFALMWNK